MTQVRVTVGVCGGGPGAEGWVRLLTQERLPFERVQEPVMGLTLFSDQLPDWFESYVSNGGIAVVSGAPDAEGVLPVAESAVINRFVSPVDGQTSVAAPTISTLFRGEGYGECRLHEDRKVKGENDPDVFPAVLQRPLGRGHIVFSGIPLTRLLMSGGDSLRVIPPGAEFTERVASVDKAEVCDTLGWMLQRGFAHWAVPYPRIGRFPHGHPSVFIFRVDVDGIFGDRTRKIAETATGHGIRASFFFNGSLCDEYRGELGAWINEHEIGQHGYLHNVFDSVEENLTNLERGKAWVAENLGIESEGFVAPRGLWNSALDQALAKGGYQYSSDFGWDFDSLPFHTDHGVLQIPVHPYSPERATMQAIESERPPPTPGDVLRQYLRTIDRQIGRGRPAYIYGHPEVLGSMALEILPDLFRAAASRAPAMTVAGFHDWWTKRLGVTTTIDYNVDHGQLWIRVSDRPRVTLELFDHPTISLDLNGDHFDLTASQKSVIPVGQETEIGGGQ